MRRVARVAVPVVFVAWFCATDCRAEDTKELVLFKGTGAHVHWLAFSADGSRLAAAAAGWKVEGKKIVKVPGNAVVWDVDGRRQVCACQAANADFTHVWLSADGKTLVTVDHGQSHYNNNEELAIMVAANAGYQAWDAVAGKSIGSRIGAKGLGEFTAAAVSPDGRYLAMVWNEQAVGHSAPNKPYVAGEVRVWDLVEQKVKWTLAGSPHTGQIVWVDSLAFSPDGKRLAAYRSFGGPSSEAALARPDRRDTAFEPLRMLSLESGKGAPAVTVLEKGGIPLPGVVEWPSDGRTLVLRDGPTFEVIDPATGRDKESFKISMSQLQGAPLQGGPPAGLPQQGRAPGQASQVPQPPAPMPRPRKGGGGLPLPPRPGPTRLPPPDTTAEDVPQNFRGPRTALSADGTRFALYLQVARDAKRVVENRVVVWDVGTRKLLGRVRLPDEPYSLYKGHAPWGWKKDATEPSSALALSGDGKRVAVSDAVGTVRVYDTSQISGEK